MASSDERTLKILLAVQADLADLAKVNAGLKDTKAAADEGAKSAFSWGDAFKFAGADEALRKIVDSVKEIPAGIEEAIKSGVDFQAQMQQVQTGIAGILRQNQGGVFLDFSAAKQQAGDYVELLKQKANEFGIAYSDMFEAYTHSVNSMFAGGITSIEQQIQLIATMNRAVQSIGLSANTAARDIVDLLAGFASRTIGGRQLAPAMGFADVTEMDTAIQKANQAGQAFQFWTERMQGFQEAIRDGAQNFNADIERMRNAVTELESEAAKPVMAPLKDALESFASSDFKIAAQEIGQFVASLVEEFHTLATAVGDVSTGLSKFSGLAGAFGGLPGFLAGKAGQSAGDLESNNQVIAIAKQTEEIVKQVANAHELNDQVAARYALEDAIFSIKQKITGLTGLDKSQAEGELAVLSDTLTNFDTRVGAAAQMPAKIAAIREEMQKLLDQEALFRAETYGDDADVYRAKWVLTYDTIAAEAKKAGQAISQGELEQLTYEKLRGPERQKELADLAKEADSHRGVTDLLRQESLLLQDIRGNQQRITQDPTLSAQAKEEQLHNLYLQEQAAILIDIARVRAQIKAIEAIGSPQEQALVTELTQKLHQLGLELDLLGFKTKQTTFSGGLQSDLANWVNSFGVASHQIANVIEQSIGASLQGINQLLLGSGNNTQTWQQKIVGVEQQVGNLFLTMLENMAIQQAAQLLHITTTTSAQVASGAQIAAAHAPAAAATSISSYGVAALVGEIAAIAAIAAIMAALGGGFRKGGYTGDGSADEIAGPAHKKEFVFTAEETAALGVPFLQKLAANAGGVARFHEGGEISEAEIAAAGRFATGGADPRIAYDPDSRSYYNIDPSIEPTPIPNQPYRFPGTDLIYDPGSGLIYNSRNLSYGPGSDLTSTSDSTGPNVEVRGGSPAVETPTGPSDIPFENIDWNPAPMPAWIGGDTPYGGGDVPPENISWNAPPLPGEIPGGSGAPLEPYYSGYGIVPDVGEANPTGGEPNIGADAIYSRRGRLRSPPGFGAGLTGSFGATDILPKVRHSGGLAGDEFMSILQHGEFVQRAAAVDHYGPDFMHAINEMRVPIHHAGGSVGTGSPASFRGNDKIEIHMWSDQAEAHKKFLSSKTHRKFIQGLKLR